MQQKYKLLYNKINHYTMLYIYTRESGRGVRSYRPPKKFWRDLVLRSPGCTSFGGVEPPILGNGSRRYIYLVCDMDMTGAKKKNSYYESNYFLYSILHFSLSTSSLSPSISLICIYFPIFPTLLLV